MKTKMKVYRVLAQRVVEFNSENSEKTHAAELLTKVMDTAPTGSGIDAGIALDVPRSDACNLVFRLEFHHMDEDGCYNGWTNHIVRATGNLAFGLDVKTRGQNRNGIKEYLSELFYQWLDSEIEAEWDSNTKKWTVTHEVQA